MENKRQITTSIDDILFKDEFIKHFDVIVKFVKEMKAKNDEDLAGMETKIESLIEDAKSETGDNASEIKKEAMAYCMGEMEKIIEEHKEKLQEADDKMALIQDGKDSDEERITENIISKIQEPIINEIQNNLPSLGIATRNGLELLRDDERLDSSAVKGIVGIHIGADEPEDKNKLWIDIN